MKNSTSSPEPKKDKSVAEDLLQNANTEANKKSSFEESRSIFSRFNDYMFEKLLNFFRWSDSAFKTFQSNFFRWSNSIGEKYKFLHNAWSIVSHSFQLAKNFILEPLLKVVPLANFITGMIFTIIEFVDLVLTKATDLDEEEKLLFNKEEGERIIQEKQNSKTIKIINAIVGTSLGVTAFVMCAFLAMSPVGLGLLLAGTVLAAAKDIYFYKKSSDSLKSASVLFEEEKKNFTAYLETIKDKMDEFNHLNELIEAMTSINLEIENLKNIVSNDPQHRQRLAELEYKKVEISLVTDIEALIAQRKQIEDKILKAGIIDKYNTYTENCEKQIAKIAKLEKIRDERKSAVQYAILGVATMLLFTLAAVAVLNPYTLTIAGVSLLCVSFVKAVKDKIYNKKSGKKKGDVNSMTIVNSIAETGRDNKITNEINMNNSQRFIAHQMAVSQCKRSSIINIPTEEENILRANHVGENDSDMPSNTSSTSTPHGDQPAPAATQNQASEDVRTSTSRPQI